MIKVITLILLVLFVTTKNNAQTNTKQDRIQTAVDSVRKVYETITSRSCPSVSILIHTANDTFFASSVAEGNEPLTKDTYFRFASNTKNFTATSILNMYEDGWLDFRARIVDTIPGSKLTYVPDTPEFDIPYKNEITIEQLLNHSAGVYDIDNDSVPGLGGHSYTDYMTFQNPAHQFELPELVNQDAKYQLSYFPPSKGYHYSNTGYTILSEIIQRVYSFRSGGPKKYLDYINDYITGSNTPVPMDVGFPYLASDVSIPSPYVKGYLLTPDSTDVFTTVNVSAHVGEGNGYATFAELDKHIRTIMKGENVLTPSSIELMKNTVSDSNKTYALGCMYIKDLGYGHNGCIKGYLSFMMYDPATDVSVIIMMPVNDYTFAHEKGIEYGLIALVNAGFASRIALGYPGRIIEYPDRF